MMSRSFIGMDSQMASETWSLKNVHGVYL